MLRSIPEKEGRTDLRLLGPLEASEEGRPLALGAAKQRALLALLLLHRGRPVSVERLIEELWPERPPPSAAKSVQVYVSNLRRVLGPARVRTRDHAYELVAGDDEVDAVRFERLLDEGRTALRAGKPDRARSLLSDALALWRGAALADLAYERFAQAETARLEELRLTAVEERIEAELEAGGGTELVAELYSLVREHPLRERLHGQLMRALYRSGRQADALSAYRDARRALVVELGIEPGPDLQELERGILAHDPALGRPRPVEVARRRRWLVAGAGATLLAAALATGLAVALTGGGERGLPTLPANAVATFDPETGRMADAVELPIEPYRLAARGASAWAADRRGTIVQLRTAGAAPAKVVNAEMRVSDLTLADDGVWVASAASGRLARVDAGYGVVTQRVALGRPSAAYADLPIRDGWSTAAGFGALWATDGSRTLWRVDVSTGAVGAIRLGVPLNAVEVGAGAVWVASGERATVVRLDPRSGAPTLRLSVVDRPARDSPYPVDLAVGDGAVWVLNANTATVTRIDPGERGVTATIPLGVDRQPRRLAAGRGAVWVANGDGTLAHIDARTNDIGIVPVGREVRDVAVAGGQVWLATGPASGIARGPASVPAGIQPVTAPACSPVFYRGTGAPDYVVTTNQPLGGPFSYHAHPMLAAITLVFEQRGFRAGLYRVALQVCDTADAAGFVDFSKCAANARAVAANRSVIAALASLLSACAKFEIPTLGTAAHGPIGLVGITNTAVTLTRAGPEKAARYYPSGVRNFVRLWPAEDYQSAANALLARRLGLRRVYVVYPKRLWGEALRAEFTGAARRLGIGIPGAAAWDPDAGHYRQLGALVAASGADAVFLAGTLGDNGATLIRDLRARLGPAFPIVAPDGFSPASDTAAVVGPAAEGMTVSTPGLPVDRLGATGRRFAAAFRRATGQAATSSAVYAAQATEVLLDAIGRSDGTRRSVIRELFRTNVRGGLVGDFAIGPTGDTTANVVTIERITRGRPSTLAVIVPPARLVRP